MTPVQLRRSLPKDKDPDYSVRDYWNYSKKSLTLQSLTE